MPRTKEKINPERGKRLKRLLKEENLSQGKLSEKIHISQQYISQVVTGKAPLTDHIAYDTAKLFPEKNLLYKWLICEEEFESSLEKLYSELAKAGEEEAALYAGFYNFAELAGFKIDIIPNAEKDPLKRAIRKAIPKYQIKKNGKVLAILDRGQLISLENKAYNLFSVFLNDYFA